MTPAVSTGDLLEGRFRIRTELFRRGGRAIYFGSDTHTRRRCELHVLEPSAPDSVQVEFAREVELLGRIDHPGCLSAIALGGLPGGTLYYVTPERLVARVADRIGAKLPPSHVVDVATQLLHVLQRIHQLDWRLGWLTPDAVDEQAEDGRLVVRIVRMSAARPAKEAGPVPAGEALAFADPRLTDGTKSSIASDLFAIGRVLHQLATGSLDVRFPTDDPSGSELGAVVDRLCGSEAAVNGFSSADAAAAAFEALPRVAGEKLPAAPPTMRRSRFRTTDVEFMSDTSPAEGDEARRSAPGMSSTTDRDPALSDPHGRVIQPQLPTSLEDAAAPGRRRNVLLATIAAVAALGIVVAVATKSEPEPVRDAPDEIAVAGVPVMAAAERPPPALPPATQDPRHALVLLNQADLAQALPFIERHALLDRVMARDDLRSRVDVRWNQLLDLAQSPDAPEPCSTFRHALLELDLAPRSEAETALIATIRVPSPTTVLGAGVAPDGDCDGLDEGLASAQPPTARAAPSAAPSSGSKRQQRKPSSRGASSRTTHEKPVPVPQPEAKVAPATKRINRSRIAKPFADDIKGVE